MNTCIQNPLTQFCLVFTVASPEPHVIRSNEEAELADAVADALAEPGWTVTQFQPEPVEIEPEDFERLYNIFLS